MDKEYDEESLYDLDRDVAECFEYPEDKDFLKTENKEGFRSGIFKVTIAYYPNE